MKFSCFRFPQLGVLIERGGGELGGDKVARFEGGFYETTDAKEIAVLKATDGVIAVDAEAYVAPLSRTPEPFSSTTEPPATVEHPVRAEKEHKSTRTRKSKGAKNA